MAYAKTLRIFCSDQAEYTNVRHAWSCKEKLIALPNIFLQKNRNCCKCIRSCCEFGPQGSRGRRRNRSRSRTDGGVVAKILHDEAESKPEGVLLLPDHLGLRQLVTA